jgi:prephenate dehydrogenase
MAQPDFLSKCNVAILGLGLMGGSLALKLRGHCQSLSGCDPDPATLALARQWSLADQVTDRPGDILPQADLVILATPVRVILTLLDELPRLHPGSAAVLDLGSTKTDIVRSMQALPDRFDPVGGHPMCGKERSGLANADPDLFRSAPFALTPTPGSSPRSRGLAEQLVDLVGANPLWLDAAMHDRWVAATSHVPYLVANALAAATPLDARPMVGPGLRSTTRLAPTSWTMMRDILETNRPNILGGLQNFRKQIEILESLLAAGDLRGLEELASLGAQNYEALVR